MQIPKIILYYGFTPITDPDAIRLWQQNLAESLNLKGRILIAQLVVTLKIFANM